MFSGDAARPLRCGLRLGESRRGRATNVLDVSVIRATATTDDT